MHRTASRRALLRVLAVVGVAVAALCLLSSPSSARGHHPVHHRVPTCPALPHYARGTYAWFDNHDERSQLVTGLDRLVCSAADGATIDVKSWFVYPDGPTVRRLTAHLELMHRYHHVRVNVLVGLTGYHHADWQWRGFRKPFRFANVQWCPYTCQTVERTGTEHGKWVSVSRLRQGGSAVLSMSANISTAQYRSLQTGLLVVGNTPVYRAFAARFAAYQACARRPTSRACGRHSVAAQPAARWVGSRGTHVYFSPASSDPIAETLERVTCTGARSPHLVLASSLWVRRAAIMRELRRLDDAGCTVRVLLGLHPKRLAVGFVERCVSDHDKTLLVDSGRTRLVISGAENFGTASLTDSANQMVRTTDTRVVAAYERFYARVWSVSRSC